jgi:hypothetical protein
VFFTRFVLAGEAEEVDALHDFLDCIHEPGELITGRVDPHVRKLSARQRRAARDAKKVRHVARARASRLGG